jgi:opacity protein-like surface antigen
MLSKKLVLAAIIGLLPATSAFAAIDGPYLGFNVGYADVHQSSLSGFTITSSMSSGIAGRAYAGFQFNNNFGFEGGYAKYYNATVNGQNTLLTNATSTINSYSIDALVKGILPLAGGLALYAKVGPAYLSENQSLTATTTVLAPPPGQDFRDSQSTHKIFPEFGVGVSFDINANISADFSWMHIQHLGDNALRNVDFVALGLAYNLG